MKTVRLLILAGCALFPAFAQYVYDYPALLNPYSNSQWTTNGAITASNNMVTSSSAGSLIFKPTVPGVSNAYEVKTTLALTASGGNYYTYLGASSNLLSSPESGSGIMVELKNPTFVGTSCSATLVVNEYYYSNNKLSLSCRWSSL